MACSPRPLLAIALFGGLVSLWVTLVAARSHAWFIAERLSFALLPLVPNVPSCRRGFEETALALPLVVPSAIGGVDV